MQLADEWDTQIMLVLSEHFPDNEWHQEKYWNNGAEVT